MAIAYRHSTASFESSSSDADRTITKPTGLANGDYVIIIVHDNLTGNPTATTTPSGFTQQRRQTDAGLTTEVYVKYITDAGGEPTWQIGYGSGNFVKLNVFCIAYSGCSSSTPLHADAIAAEGDTAVTDHVTPTINITASDCWVVSCACDRNSTIPTTWSGTDTERHDGQSSGSNPPSSMLQDSNGTVSTGNHSRTLTATNSNAVATMWIGALKPADLNVNVGLVTETNTAQPIEQYWTSETDEARSITVQMGGGQNIAVGLVTETDRTFVVVKILGQLFETDTAQTITVNKLRSVNQATETDTSQSVARAKSLAIGLNTETDTAQVVTSRKSRSVNQVTETDTAQLFTVRKSRALAQNTETDTAQTVARAKSLAVGLNTETDTAQTVASSKTKTIGLTTETDLAQLISQPGGQNVPVNQVTETDRTFFVVQAIRLTAETELAQTIAASKTKTVNQVTETDTAQAIELGINVVIVSETDTAQTHDRLKSRLVGLAW